MNRIILCGSGCEHDHDSLNGPTGCCPKGHGPYLYYCEECHEQWRRANPDIAEQISQVAAGGGNLGKLRVLIAARAASPEAAKGGGE